MARPAVTGPDALEFGAMVKAYTLKALNDEGYINCIVGKCDPNFAKDLLYQDNGAHMRRQERQELMATGAKDDEYGAGELRKGEPFHIHPLLQRTQWEFITDQDWLAILPSVELASRLLDDPAIASFFDGIVQNVTKLDDPLLEKAHNRNFQRWDYDSSIIESAEKTQQALFKMMGYRKYVSLKFADAEGNYAYSTWDKNLAEIHLQKEYLPILREDAGWGAQRWSKPWFPGTNEISARLRTRVHLAVTIVHEISHCVWFINNPGKYGPEPFLRDRPINELGWELENFIFAGLINPLGDDSHVSTPYGIGLHRFPGGLLINAKEAHCYTRGSPEDWGARWSTEYPIHSDWCNKLFTADFWDEVSRFGFPHIRPERRKGVRMAADKATNASVGLNLSPKSKVVHDRRVAAMTAAVKADDIDSSDEEDKGPGDIVFRGSHKKTLQSTGKRKRGSDSE